MWFDIFIIVAYFVSIILIGLWYSRGNRDTSEGYFFANKSLNWFVIGSALFASNISTVHLVGLSEQGYLHGIVYGNFEWFSSFELIILALVFAPFFLRTKISTLPEFLEKRYDRRSRMILAFISICAALFAHIGVSFYAGAVVFKNMFGLDIHWSILIIALSTGIYTIIGGLTSVVVTETIQTVILLLGALTLTVLAILKLPEVGVHSYSDLKASVPADAFSTVNFDEKQKGFTFLDMLLGHLVLGLWYWCSDQTIVQRILGAKSEKQAQLGALFAGFLKILPVFLMVIPGIFALVLFKDEIGADSKETLPVMIQHLMPTGLRGLMIAALLAAVMSSVAAALNSSATLVSYDLLGNGKRVLGDKKRIMIGKYTAFFVLLSSVIWSLFLGNLGAMFELINQIFSIFSPPIVTVFLFGVLSKKGTASASYYTLILGSLIGLVSFVIEKYIPINGIENFISSVDGLNINWLLQTFLLFVISTFIYFIFSTLDKKQDITKDLSKIFDKEESIKTTMVVKRLSIILFITMVIIYFIFY